MVNLAYYLTRAAQRTPDATAICHGDERLDYASLNDRVGRLADGLRRLGLKPGDRVGLVVDTEPRSLECLLAPLRAGLTIVPVNNRLHPAEHAYMLDDCGARAVLCSAPRVAPLLGVRDQIPTLEFFIAMDRASIDEAGVHDYEELIEKSVPMGDMPVTGETLAWIFYTSGTTGHPKGALHTHRSLGAMVSAQLIDIFPPEPDDCMAFVTPMSHAAGLLVFHQIAVGGVNVFPSFDRFTPENIYALIERYRVTKLCLVPTMIQRLLDGPWPTEHDLSSLKTVMYGAAPMYLEPLREALRRFGPVFTGVYAQGEAPLAVSFLPKAEHVANSAVEEQRLASVGVECFGVQLDVVDSEDRPAPPNVPGEIVVRGDLVMQGYWNAPEASAETLRNGWLHTGDIGHLDADRYLYITDRLKDMIIKGGTNVYPREIEEILHRHPAVAEATVFGIPDTEWGEKIAAAIVLRPDTTVDAGEIIDWCGSSIASFKLPSDVHFVPELIKSSYGKVLKREMKASLYPQ